jgi:hypothetical protein
MLLEEVAQLADTGKRGRVVEDLGHFLFRFFILLQLVFDLEQRGTTTTTTDTHNRRFLVVWGWFKCIALATMLDR